MTGVPSIRIWPLEGFINVAIILRTVLLPEPDGPSKATNSPRRTLKETSRTASIVVPVSWNDLLNRLTSIRCTSGGRGGGVAYDCRSDQPCRRRSGTKSISDLRAQDLRAQGTSATPQPRPPDVQRIDVMRLSR